VSHNQPDQAMSRRTRQRRSTPDQKGKAQDTPEP
jgi:hypothetical protein